MAGKFEEAIEYLEASLAEDQTDDRLFQTALVYLQLKEMSMRFDICSSCGH